ARYDFSGHVDLKSYSAPATADVVALPLDGSTEYNLTPDEARVANADVRLHSTTLKADGVIQNTTANLKLNVDSSDLKDIALLYADAKGSGSFNGSISGALAKPILDGEFTLQNHVYRDRTIQHAAGGVRLDLMTENAVLRNVRVKQGESEVLLNGTAALS